MAKLFKNWQCQVNAGRPGFKHGGQHNQCSRRRNHPGLHSCKMAEGWLTWDDRYLAELKLSKRRPSK